MKVTLIQQNIIWENREANLAQLDILLNKLNPNDTNLIILPEMFTTGFSMNTIKNAVGMNSDEVNWLINKAEILNSTIIGSMIINEDGNRYNRLLIASKDGIICQYDKRHLFRMGNENQNYQAGKSIQESNIMNWKVRPLICYDLRFPVWSRNDSNYHLLVYVANWPASRADIWTSLLKARAIENQSYVIGVNRVGTDGEGINYSGDSVVFNPKGEAILSLPANQETIMSTELSMEELVSFKEKFPAWRDADKFRITLY